MTVSLGDSHEGLNAKLMLCTDYNLRQVKLTQPRVGQLCGFNFLGILLQTQLTKNYDVM